VRKNCTPGSVRGLRSNSQFYRDQVPFFARPSGKPVNARALVVFCKLNYKNLSAIDLFLKSIEKFAPANIPFIKLPCPCCGAKNPGRSYHDSYKRYLISFENNQLKIEEINITRIICSSCKHTHAILPEIIIPYCSYSLLFVLSVLKDYFSKMGITLES
jgi:hypothetical protein